MNRFIPQRLFGRTVFVDTSPLILHFTGRSEACAEFFSLSEQEWLKGVTSVRVLDEFLFKVMVLEAAERYGYTGRVHEKLRKDPKKVKELSDVLHDALQFVKAAKVRVEEVSPKDLDELPRIMEQYGVFGNDGITVRLMERFNMKYLFSTDSDFDRVEWIVRINPLHPPRTPPPIDR